MSSLEIQPAVLRTQMDPVIHALPVDLLRDVAGNLLSGLWTKVLAEGQPVASVVAHLTGLGPGPELESLITRVLCTDFKNKCLSLAWRTSGLGYTKTLVECPDAQRLQQMYRDHKAAIFVFSHFGPRYAIAPAFQSVGVPVAMFQGLIPPPLRLEDMERFAAELPGMEFYWTSDAGVNRAVYLKRAVERLQRGELVAMAIDAGHGDVLTDAEFFGHRIQVARGPAVLARLTGAPLVPITVTWNEGWAMEFRIHDPIARPENVPTSDQDVVLTRCAVQFFEAFLRRVPEQMRLDRMARLITRNRVS